MYKAALFDFDGTLVNTLSDLAYCAHNALKTVDLTAPEDENEYKYLVGNGVDILVHRLLALHGRDEEETFQRAVSVFRKFYNENPVYLSTVYEGMMPLLTQLKEQGIKLGIVTNKPHSTALLCTEKLFGNELFDLCCGQQEGLGVKPDPTGARNVLQEFGVSPEETVYVGDTGVDMQTGKALGAYTVGVLWGFRKREELEENGADLIISHPSELLQLF